MSDVSKVVLLDEAMKLLGPLTPEEKIAATFLITMLGNVSVEHRPSYRQTMQALSEIEQAAKQIENRLGMLDPLVLDTLPAVKKLLSTLSPHTVLVEVDELLPDSAKRSAPRSFGFVRPADAARMIASRARDAQNDVERRLVKGGPNAFRAKLGPSAKQTFVQYCSDVWFLSGRVFDRGPRGNFLRFVHLIYEALTGVSDEKGSGLRDLIAKSRRQTLERYSNPSSVLARMHQLKINKIFREGPVAAAANAEHTLIQGWLNRLATRPEALTANP